MSIEVVIAVVVIAAILEFFDAGAGMGFGEITAILIAMGFHPLEVVPAVILASAVLSAIAGLLHMRTGNVDFWNPRTLRIWLMLTGFGIAAIVSGAFVAANIPEIWLTGYIGAIVVVLGVLILVKWKRKLAFSWKRLVGCGMLASFNKGMTGGGYGPVLATGQILAGVNSKRAVGLTASSEAVVSAVGVLTYLFALSVPFNWPLLFALVGGGMVGSPIAVYTVKKVDPKKLRLAVGVVSVLVGLFVLGRFVLHVF